MSIWGKSIDLREPGWLSDYLELMLSRKDIQRMVLFNNLSTDDLVGFLKDHFGRNEHMSLEGWASSMKRHWPIHKQDVRSYYDKETLDKETVEVSKPAARQRL